MNTNKFVAMIISLGAALLVTSVATSTPVAAAPASEACFEFDAGSGVITNYYDNENNDSSQAACPRQVETPAQIGGVPVVQVGDFAFSSKQLTGLILPATVTTIGSSAFNDNQLGDVTLPNSVTTIQNAGFNNAGLTNIQLPNSLVSIDQNAFNNNKLTNVVIPNSVTSLGSDSFTFNGMKSLTLSNSLTTIPFGAFANNELTSVIIPNSVTSIDNQAFAQNKLTSLTLPSSLVSIGPNAFQANRLTSVEIPDNVTTIDRTAFAMNNSVASLPFPASNQDVLDRYLPNVHYVALYTSDRTTNPRGFLNFGFVTREEELGADVNGDGRTDGVFNFGGHLINPTAVTLRYQDTAGTALRPSTQQVGNLADQNKPLTDYLAVNGPALPRLSNPNSPTPADDQLVSDALAAAYYLIGQERQLSAPTIAGYRLVSPSPLTLRLTASDNTATFTYQQIIGGGTANPTPQVPGAPNTGVGSTSSFAALLAPAAALFVWGIVSVGMWRVFGWYRARRQVPRPRNRL